jgi:hypothetical protein
MKKRGRKSGSGSFVQVSLGELNNVLKPGAKVIVWARYASMLGLQGNPVEAKYDVLMAAVHGGQTEFEVQNFEADFSEGEEKFENTEKNEKPDLTPKPSVSLEVF